MQKITIIPNVALQLAESNGMIYHILKQCNTKSKKSTISSASESIDYTPITTISNLEQQISQLVSTFTKELTTIQHQQKILIDSVLLITQSSQSNYIMQKEILEQIKNINDRISNLQQTVTNENSNDEGQNKDNNINIRNKDSSPPPISIMPTNQTPPIPAIHSTPSNNSNKHTPFFNPKNMFNNK